MIKDKVPRINFFNAYNESFPPLSKESKWIILGSKYSVYDDVEWIDSFKKHILKGVEMGVPMLGICFGHQIIASALGAKVVNNKKGWELGSSKVNLTSIGCKSSLFKSLHKSFDVYESHHDTVVNIPKKIDVLAQNEYGLQAFSYSDYVFGVQFHPEFKYDVMKAYYKARKDKLKNKDKYYVVNQNQGVKVLNNFIDINLRGE